MLMNPKVRWVLFGLYALVLTNLLLTPNPWWVFGKVSEAIDIKVDATLDDFYQHMGVFVIFTGLLLFAAAGTGKPTVMTAIVIACVYSVVTECIQHYVPNRFFDPIDAVANFSGVLVGGMLVLVLGPWLGRVFAPVSKKQESS